MYEFPVVLWSGVICIACRVGHGLSYCDSHLGPHSLLFYLLMDAYLSLIQKTDAIFGRTLIAPHNTSSLIDLRLLSSSGAITLTVCSLMQVPLSRFRRSMLHFDIQKHGNNFLQRLTGHLKSWVRKYKKQSGSSFFILGVYAYFHTYR